MKTLNRLSLAKDWVNAALAFVYPETCNLCGTNRATPAQGYVCDPCRRSVQFLEPPFCERCGLPFAGAITTAFECGNCKELKLHFHSARSAVAATQNMLEAIHRYKYSHALWLEPFLAGLLIERARPHVVKENWDAIVPVPLHSAKLREREFNQAERLAKRLSNAVGVRVNSRLVRRIQPTRTQTLLSRAERLANVRNAFAVTTDVDLSGQRILLVDDVMTTGATTSACARVLRQAGADKVCVWTLARGT